MRSWIGRASPQACPILITAASRDQVPKPGHERLPLCFRTRRKQVHLGLPELMRRLECLLLRPLEIGGS